jgi:hypothetical protein
MMISLNHIVRQTKSLITMTGKDKGVQITDIDKYLIDLRADYDEQLKENEGCRQLLGR